MSSSLLALPDAKKRRVSARDARTLQRVLRTAERAATAPIGVVAINPITAVPTVLLHAAPLAAVQPVDESLWDALVAAEDAPAPESAVRVVGSAAPVRRFDSLADAVSWRAPVTVPANAQVEPPLQVPRSSAPVIGAAAVPDDDPYGVRQWPVTIRSRSFAVCMPAADRRRVGRCCVLWMLGSPRLQFNLALKLALLIADRLHMPLLVVAQVSSLATVSTALAGLLRELWLALADRGVTMLIGETSTPAASMARLLCAIDAHVCVADEPLDPLMRRWLQECADALRASPARYCALFAVATSTLAAPRYASLNGCDALWHANALAEFARFDATLPDTYRPSVPLDATWLAQVRSAAAQAGVTLRDGAALPGAGFAADALGESEWRALTVDRLRRLSQEPNVASLSEEWFRLCRNVLHGVRLGAVSAVDVALTLVVCQELIPRERYAEVSALVGLERELRVIEQWQAAQQR